MHLVSKTVRWFTILLLGITLAGQSVFAFQANTVDSASTKRGARMCCAGCTGCASMACCVKSGNSTPASMPARPSNNLRNNLSALFSSTVALPAHLTPGAADEAVSPISFLADSQIPIFQRDCAFLI